MNKKMIYALIVAVVIVVVAVVGVYVLMNNGGTTQNTVKVKDATSLQYNAEVSYQGATPTLFNWTAKNVGATDLVLRIDILGGVSGNYTYIMYNGTQTAWLSTNGTWTNVSNDFTNQWNTWAGTGKQWTLNLNALETNWSGTGDCTYTTPSGNSVRIYNVVINPALADSLFQSNT